MRIWIVKIKKLENFLACLEWLEEVEVAVTGISSKGQNRMSFNRARAIGKFSYNKSITWTYKPYTYADGRMIYIFYFNNRQLAGLFKLMGF